MLRALRSSPSGPLQLPQVVPPPAVPAMKSGATCLPLCVDFAATSDADLVLAARAGDAGGFGALLERHRAGMLAVALSILGYGPETEDAVQDAALTAFARIDQLRDPAIAGAWLRAIVRTVCQMRVRARGAQERRRVEERLLPPTAVPSADERLERHALRNWVWCALEELSEPLRLPVLLRYFSGVSSYVEIATLCDVPVGTGEICRGSSPRPTGSSARSAPVSATGSSHGPSAQEWPPRSGSAIRWPVRCRSCSGSAVRRRSWKTCAGSHVARGSGSESSRRTTRPRRSRARRREAGRPLRQPGEMK